MYNIVLMYILFINSIRQNLEKGAMGLDSAIASEVDKQIQKMLEERKNALDAQTKEKDPELFDESDSLASEFFGMDDSDTMPFSIPEPAPAPEPIPAPPRIRTCSVGVQVDFEVPRSLYELDHSDDEEEEEISVPSEETPEVIEVPEQVIEPDPEPEPESEPEPEPKLEPEPEPENIIEEEIQQPIQEEHIEEVTKEEIPVEVPIVQEEETKPEPVIVDNGRSQEEWDAQEAKILELENTSQELRQKVKQTTKEIRVLRGTVKQLSSVHDKYRDQISTLEKEAKAQQAKYHKKVDELEDTLKQQKEKEISVLEQLFRLRERFSYAQKVIKSPTMKTVLKVLY